MKILQRSLCLLVFGQGLAELAAGGQGVRLLNDFENSEILIFLLVGKGWQRESQQECAGEPAHPLGGTTDKPNRYKRGGDSGLAGCAHSGKPRILAGAVNQRTNGSDEWRVMVRI